MGKHYSKKDREKLKKQFLENMEESKGMVTTSAERIGVSRETISNWRESDPEFNEAVQAIQDKIKEYVEGRLMSLIENGNTAATMFFLKCRAGYRETNKLEIENKNDIDVNAAIAEIKEQLSK